MKTRREHLSVLPKEVLEEIHEEIKLGVLPEIEIMGHFCDKEEAIKGLFVFSETEKGHTYWWIIYEKYIK
jgi:hypothetical protein